MHVLVAEVGHIHIERRTVALDLFLPRAHDLIAALAVFAHRVILEHEPFAERVDFLAAHVVDAVHAGRAPTLGDERRAAADVDIDQRRTDLHGQDEIAAGVVRHMPAVVGVAGGVVGQALGVPAEGTDGGFAFDGVHFAGQDVEAHAAHDVPAALEQAGDVEVVEDVDAGLAHAAGQMPLDGRAVGDVQPPRAGLAEADGTIPLAVLDQEFRIDFLKDFHARLDGVEPLVELGFAVAESGLHEEADKGFAGVVGFVGAERRHEMVVAAAEAAGAFQPPLPHHEHVGLKFRRAQGCTDT